MHMLWRERTYRSVRNKVPPIPADSSVNNSFHNLDDHIEDNKK